MSANSENDVFKKKLLKYIQQDNIDVKGDDELSNTFVKKNVLEIHPSNSYLNSNNVPNFESNVIDTSKFYNVQQYDNLNENDLKKTSKNLLKNMDIDIQKQNSIQGEGRGGAVRVSTEFPDNWTYKNELPMNGGEMSGIYGFDELESQFAVFDKTRIGPTGNEFNNIAQNDLRKPIVYN